MTYDKFITANNLQFTADWVSARPDNLMDTNMNHYKCRITCTRFVPNVRSESRYRKQARGFTLYFSQGFGITHEPKLADVLDCLASDAAGYENASTFEDWAEEYGYDTDSRKAERMYRTIKRQAEQLRRTIGDEAYQTLLWEMERL